MQNRSSDQGRQAWHEYAEWLTAQQQFTERPGPSPAPEVLALLNRRRPRSLVHLMCGTGQELLELSRLDWFTEGVGIDWGTAFMSSARSRSAEAKCRFITDDVSNFLRAPSQYGVSSVECVLTTYGTLWWIQDLQTYLDGVARLLAGGGWYIASDFHPILICMNPNGTHRDRFPVATAIHDHPAGLRDYVLGSSAFIGNYPVRYYVHALGAIINAGVQAGLRVVHMTEYSTVHADRFIPAMIERHDGQLGLPGDYLPLSFILIFAATPEET